ncbi:MAG: alpha-hydroxy-acid oxidizing protein [Solobacterium sp.]|nr:alpha-hydroxy-acid oxidizing protein [Solobacterium sp.]
MKCRECKVCNGIVCAGEIPGLGGKDSGRAFMRNVEMMQKIKLIMDVCVDDGPISTKTNILGIDLSMPIFAAPLASIEGNYGYPISDYDYNVKLLETCIKKGIRAFTGDGVNAEEFFIKPSFAINELEGKGILTMKPWIKEGIDLRLKAIEGLKYDALAMDVDAAGLPLLRKAEYPVENKNVESLQYVIDQIHAPFIVKGVLNIHAAKVAYEAGASAIVVSNHGGRVLDDAISGVEALEEIAQEFKGKMTILVDGGIRSGMDVFKCLALGADGVLVGRPFALANIKGQLEETIDLYHRQLIETMRMTGCHNLKDITRENVKV